MIRSLTASDVPDALELSDAAGWNQTEADWLRLVNIAPDGCLGIERYGRIVATTTLLSYGDVLAWIGMVLTHRDHQRKGYARTLLEHALTAAAGRGIRTIKLDATDQGRPLYLAMGFRDEQPVERWAREPEASIASIRVAHGRHDVELDRAAFGADRGPLLVTLGEALVADHGHVFYRPGARARYLGPCIAASPDTAAKVISAALCEGGLAEPWYWDLLPRNEQAVRLARRFGFRPVRHLVRMVRGEEMTGNESMVYAIAGFEAG